MCHSLPGQAIRRTHLALHFHGAEAATSPAATLDSVHAAGEPVRRSAVRKAQYGRRRQLRGAAAPQLNLPPRSEEEPPSRPRPQRIQKGEGPASSLLLAPAAPGRRRETTRMRARSQEEGKLRHTCSGRACASLAPRGGRSAARAGARAGARDTCRRSSGDCERACAPVGNTC